MEAIFGFILGIALNWWFFVFCVCGCLFCEHKESRVWAAIFAIALGAIAFTLLGLTLSQLWWVIGAYIPVGFVWSFWRWKRHCDRVEKQFAAGELRTESGRNKADKSEALTMIELKSNLDRVVYWIFMWPFSFLEQFVGDLIDGVERVVRGIADATYNKISAKSAAGIEAAAEAASNRAAQDE